MKGDIESQLAEDYYNSIGVDFVSKNVKLKVGVPFELKKGIPLTTKDANRYSNAVIYSVVNGQHRCQVSVISDYGNIIKFPSIEDMLEYYEISKTYLEMLHLSNEYNVGGDALDTQFCLRDRLERQIELLTNALSQLS